MVLQFGERVLSARRVMMNVESVLRDLLRGRVLYLGLARVSPARVRPLLRGGRTNLKGDRLLDAVGRVQFPISVRGCVVSLVVRRQRRCP